MKKSRFSDSQIAGAIKQHELGVPVADICRKMGVADATFYQWKKRFSGLESSELKKLRVLEEENRRLKQLVADLTLDKSMLQDVLSKKL